MTSAEFDRLVERALAGIPARLLGGLNQLLWVDAKGAFKIFDGVLRTHHRRRKE